jgi:hypothetical protein
LLYHKLEKGENAKKIGEMAPASLGDDMWDEYFIKIPLYYRDELWHIIWSLIYTFVLISNTGLHT